MSRRRCFFRALSRVVCFECRKCIKRHVDTKVVPGRGGESAPLQPVPCPSCGRPCHLVHYKTEVPPHTDKRAWQLLHDRIMAFRQRRADEHRARAVGQKHELERRIQELLSRPKNKERSRVIAALQRKLDRLNDASSGSS